ncbi:MULTISPECIES: MFS transporter [unclassified Streptomyces]|uniref:MFS transporter n=1 Tax=unclassified Streptomyces TaxID=2593676 RepID=UPI000887F0B6|nr:MULTISPECIES: MFS transporter [unclassified Streptomyces]PBC86049.1 putative MFS family arabinose efflux permease [Streptomyces sp. 2321.6]SDQ97918.1 Predicted arabinose efflux permease, MFS family [Streptomyces sp. KS_16]SED86995.1 Predicted arabinose efflux permease, MFS family [Streptomyces sp. 2133.1]SNC72929.1 Predicted arabinose efflux permease, MFS family [Streptomyces sp. 2114.4]
MPVSPLPTPGARLLTALAGAQLLVALDFSIIYVALPDIGASLHFSAVALQWIVSAYAIFFAGFLLLGGQLADVFGAGRVYLTAQLLFAASSIGAALSPSAGVLIAARVGQGVAAALLVPATLGLLSSAYPTGPERDRAVSVWGTTGAVGLALGVTAGGGILAVASWQWIFWINIPIVVICLLAAGNAVRSTTAGARAPVATVATFSACAAVVALVLAFTELSRARPSLPVVAAALAVTIPAGALLSLSQRRRRPLVPRALLRVRTLQVACLAAALYMASFGAEFYLVTLYLQDVRDYSAFAAGLAFLPLAGAITVGNTVAGRLAGRLPLRRLLSTAFLTGAAGLVVLALAVGAEGGYLPAILPGLLLSGLGQGMAFTGMFITGTRDLPQASNATGSALVTTAQYLGGSLGLALLVLIHGEQPATADFVRTFCVTAVIAAAAAPSALFLLTRTGRPPAPVSRQDQPSQHRTGGHR